MSTETDRMIILRQVRIFQDLSHNELLGLAAIVEAKYYEVGDAVFEEGDQGKHLYVVQSGAAEVHQRGRHLRRIEPGEYFGEMALIDDSPRSASVSMIEDGVLLGLHRDVFQRLAKENPVIYEEFCRLLVERLRGQTPE